MSDKATKEPAADMTSEIHLGCIRKGLVPVHEDGLWWLRLYPALNVPESTFEIGLDIVEEAIDETVRKYGLGTT